MIQKDRKQAIRTELAQARERTLRLFRCVPDDYYNVRVHDFYSPIGWHFGHIGMTEELWVAREALGLPVRDERLGFLFANLPENPKDNRVHLPARDEVLAYLESTRSRTLNLLDQADISDVVFEEIEAPVDCRGDVINGTPIGSKVNARLLADGYVWRFALQHECQHQETIAELLQIITMRKAGAVPFQRSMYSVGNGASSTFAAETEMVRIPAGRFMMGSDERDGYDNEKRAHLVEVEAFELDRAPVTAAQWVAFMNDGGYARPELWTTAGWSWRCRETVTRPEYWHPAACVFGYRSFGAFFAREIAPSEPAGSLSWYEADAYARWIGKRLPTEAEWEYAAAYDPDCQNTRVYPWGNDWPTSERAEYGINAFAPAPVGKRVSGSSALGLLDMAGNVWEWTSTPFQPYPGFRAYPYDGYSLEHMDGRHYVCRGGSWATAAQILRSTFRNWYVPEYRQGFLGLRCAR